MENKSMEMYFDTKSKHLMTHVATCPTWIHHWNLLTQKTADASSGNSVICQYQTNMHLFVFVEFS
jgi:hypothetical protein